MKSLTTTYTERAGKMAHKARHRAFKTAALCLERFKADSLQIGSLRVDRLNKLREAGRQFNIGCGREQLSFGLEGVEFTRKEILPLMPEGIGVNDIHACVLSANKMTEPAKTPEEVDTLEKLFQHEFEMLGLVENRKRKELQSALARNLFSDFVNLFAGAKVKMDELEKEEPMEKWPDEKLDEFIFSSAPVKAKILRAEALMAGHRQTS